MPLRKSTPVAATNGNTAKYLSYREAWARIYKAQAHGFYLEAVTIAESIIGDRLLSYLVRVGALVRRPESKTYPRFHQLIEKWRALHPEPIRTPEIRNLQLAVDTWKSKRNEVVHSIVRSHPGTPIKGIDAFLLDAQVTAIEGGVLARAVCVWAESTKRKARAVSATLS
jgi:hypothetical protein